MSWNCLLISCALLFLSSLTFYSVEDILQVLIVFIVESLELNFALLFPERHTLLRVLPVLVVLASSSEKDSESLYKRVKINRLINIFKVCSFCSYYDIKFTTSYSLPLGKLSFVTFLCMQNDPVIPAFPDLHLSPAAILKELSAYFPKFSAQTRALTLPAPHELQPREAQEYPFSVFLTFNLLCCFWCCSILGSCESDSVFLKLTFHYCW